MPGACAPVATWCMSCLAALEPMLLVALFPKDAFFKPEIIYFSIGHKRNDVIRDKCSSVICRDCINFNESILREAQRHALAHALVPAGIDDKHDKHEHEPEVLSFMP